MKFDGQEVSLNFTTYQDNGRLALQMLDENGMHYGVVTVNLVNEKLSNERSSFIDTNNWGEDIIDWLEDNNLGHTTGLYGLSGFCVYPEFEFNADLLN